MLLLLLLELSPNGARLLGSRAQALLGGGDGDNSYPTSGRFFFFQGRHRGAENGVPVGWRREKTLTPNPCYVHASAASIFLRCVPGGGESKHAADLNVAVFTPKGWRGECHTDLLAFMTFWPFLLLSLGDRWLGHGTWTWMRGFLERVRAEGGGGGIGHKNPSAAAISKGRLFCAFWCWVGGPVGLLRETPSPSPSMALASMWVLFFVLSRVYSGLFCCGLRAVLHVGCGFLCCLVLSCLFLPLSSVDRSRSSPAPRKCLIYLHHIAVLQRQAEYGK
ncbi:unnamed protein product [Laminaria digitata]